MIEIALTGARWLQFAAAALLCGVPAFALYGLTPTAADAERHWIRRTLSVALILGLTGATLLLLAQSAEMTGDLGGAFDPAIVWAVVSETAFGSVWSWRLAFVLLLGVAVFSLPDRVYRTPVLAFGGGVLAGSLAWLGHGGEGELGFREVHRVADVLHVLAASVWIGALVVLARLLKRADRDTLYALTKFSGVGSIAVGAIVLTGVVNAWALIAPTSIEEAIGTPYGLTLLIKVVLFMLMLALAALNRFVLTPRFSRGLEGDTQVSVAALKRSILVETILAALVIGAVSALGVMEPPNAG